MVVTRELSSGLQSDVFHCDSDLQLSGVIHALATDGAVDYHVHLQRRLCGDLCDPPAAVGGPDVGRPLAHRRHPLRPRLLRRRARAHLRLQSHHLFRDHPLRRRPLLLPTVLPLIGHDGLQILGFDHQRRSRVFSRLEASSLGDQLERSPTIRHGVPQSNGRRQRR
ncbi:hypothetical protein PGTUg99_030211 [Puccinia graminis f. sp. tritici]|uniref:Uncharacterized protein n=1 Tax=Puccinia graminis f. sp. tritici TaxID=56615 RepID=A0A5B0R9Q3_PUCGR|nr:hypothetical protein PGTUg99_030211 [Puccinia graminis f. sp. tritici]